MLLAEIGLGPFKIEDPSIYVALLIGFVLIVVFFWKVNIPGSVPYFRDVLGPRAERIQDEQDQVKKALEETERIRNDYKRRLDQIEAEQTQRLNDAVREADAARESIIAEAQESVQAIRRRAEDELARERVRQRIQLRRAIVELTLDAAEHSVNENSTEAVQHQLIRRFIADAGAMGNGGAATGARGES
jgi:F-type H+-transporting ATPase subunit b